MAGHTFFGKQKLCYTEVSDFTDFQGIGRDPMYKRYDSVHSVIKRAVPAGLLHFLATPEYIDEEDQICWHVDNWVEHPIPLRELSGSDYTKYKAILDNTIKIYKESVKRLQGEDLQILAGAIKYWDEDRIYCGEEKVYLVAWGMTPDTRQHKVIGSIIHEFEYVKKYKITFEAGKHGTLSKLDKSINRAEGTTLSESDLPIVQVSEGWDFVEWQPSPIGQIVSSDMCFTAQYVKSKPTVLPEPPIPPISLISEDEPEVPQEPCPFSTQQVNIERHPCLPWYKRVWLWITGLFTGKDCLRWLLWLLLCMLGLWLLSALFRSCDKESYTIDNGVVPINSVDRGDGRMVDDNGTCHPVMDNGGRLPDDSRITAPVFGDDDTKVPIVEQPGIPNTIGNRLFLFMEEENGDLEALAQDFKKVYPGDEYTVIGYDKEVKLLVIQIPENERDQIRQNLNTQLPDHKFLVFDEEIYELHGGKAERSLPAGWHLQAIHLKEGWTITKGSPAVKIAVVDDGIEADHPMFRGRIVDAYNVYTQDNRLSTGEGHGTHTAGLAAGSAEFYNKGAAGVAPNCQIIPIQVFDNGQCPLSALVAGVMYAVHHGADVVNLSVGPSFKGLNLLPVEQQDLIARSQFKQVERLWLRVSALAAQKNCILVFAAGNDDILSSIPPENRNLAALAVAAVDDHFYPTDFTNYGPCSDISAPGKSIYSAFPEQTFTSMDGTSMAAPIVSGTIALMKSLKKDLTIEEARNVLYKTGADVYGYIPPMVLVDKVLEGVQRGDFGEPNKRSIRPVPSGEGDDSAANQMPPERTHRPSDPERDRTAAEVDYEYIKKQIAAYKKKIEELEQLLPKKEN